MRLVLFAFNALLIIGGAALALWRLWKAYAGSKDG